MYSSKHLTKVVAFPLCDVDGVLMDALCDTSGATGTREDALLFAWRLSLPEGMNVAQAAHAVLAAAESIPNSAWNERQLSIVRELRMLAECGEDSPTAVRIARPAKLSKEPKDSKQWWTLVGQSPQTLKSGQRKTRKGRVSREP